MAVQDYPETPQAYEKGNDELGHPSTDSSITPVSGALEVSHHSDTQKNASQFAFWYQCFVNNCIVKILNSMAGAVVNNPYFQNSIVALIIINAIMMGIGTFPFIKDNPDRDSAFELTDLVFLIIFTVELCIQFTFHGWRLFTDAWLIFDFCIVVLSWSLQQFQIIRAFRIFRALRLITRVECLQNLVIALISVMPRMGAIVCLMALIFYIFAVMFTNLFRDIPMEDEYFTKLEYTLLTLFQMMTLEWADVARAVMKEKTWAWAPIMLFIMISSFIVYNLVVAVVCDSIFILHDAKRAKGDEVEGEGDDGNSTGESIASRNEFDEMGEEVQLLKQTQVDIQEKLEQLALALRDLGVVKVRE